MKKLLKAIVVFLLLLMVAILVAFICFIVVGKMENDEAMVNAKEYCERLEIGQKLDPQPNNTEVKGGYYYYDESTGIQRIIFHGFIYDSAQCQVTVSGGIVESKTVIMVHD